MRVPTFSIWINGKRHKLRLDPPPLEAGSAEYRIKLGERISLGLAGLCSLVLSAAFVSMILRETLSLGWLFLPVTGYLAVDYLRQGFGDGWRITTNAQGFVGLSHRRTFGQERRSFRRVRARWKDVASYRYNNGREQQLIISFTECSGLGKDLTIDVADIEPPLAQLVETFARYTRLPPRDC